MPIPLFESWNEGRARKAAARWMVRMHGPDAFRWRAAFEEWRTAHPRNALAYARQQNIWGMAPALDPALAPIADRRSVAWSMPMRLAAGLVPIGVAIGGFAIWSATRGPGALVIAAEPTRMRAEQLADGSRVILDRGSAIEVRFEPQQRALRLTRGRARFDLAPAPGRPIILRAGPAEVRTARARLDVALNDGGARIILLAGEIRLARYDEQGPEGANLALEPGQAIDVGKSREVSPARPVSPTELNWPAGMMSFDNAPLSEVVARVNALTFTPLRIGAPDIANLRVTGAYRVGDAAGLARTLAAALGLSVEHSPDGGFTLTRPAP